MGFSVVTYVDGRIVTVRTIDPTQKLIQIKPCFKAREVQNFLSTDDEGNKNTVHADM